MGGTAEYHGSVLLTHTSVPTMDTTPSPRQRALADALSGVSASIAALWIFYPLDVWKTRLQGSRHGEEHVSQARIPLQRQPSSFILVAELMEQHFAGWPWKTLHTATSSFCYFYIYSFLYASVKRAHAMNRPNQHEDHLSASLRLLIGMAAAALNTVLTLPLDVISSQRQVIPPSQPSTSGEAGEEGGVDHELVLVEDDHDCEEHDSREDESVGGLVADRASWQRSDTRSIFHRLQSYWKGLLPSLLLCSNPAIHYTVFDSLKYRLLDSKSPQATASKNLSMAEAFLLGVAAKFVATMATYPLIRAKVLLMLLDKQHVGNDDSQHSKASTGNNLWACLLHDCKQHGMSSLYRGLSLQLTHTLLKSALLMMVRERINRTTRRLLLNSSPTSGTSTLEARR